MTKMGSDKLRNKSNIYGQFGMVKKTDGVDCGVVQWVERSMLRGSEL